MHAPWPGLPSAPELGGTKGAATGWTKSLVGHILPTPAIKASKFAACFDTGSYFLTLHGGQIKNKLQITVTFTSSLSEKQKKNKNTLKIRKG